MSKSILTLVADIKDAISTMDSTSVGTGVFSNNIINSYTKQMCKQPPRERKPNAIYFSELGDPCVRKLWYKHNEPALVTNLDGATRVKFMYGDILEELVLQLARDAGHEVRDEQLELEYAIPTTSWRLRGRIDAVIDGVTVDVKSVTKFSEKKFHDGLKDDPFGYYDQLNGYASVLDTSNAGFLTIQKELGHIHYFPIQPDPAAFSRSVGRAVSTLEGGMPTDRMAPVKQNATSDNMKLCTTCSYCPYKFECWKGELRAFKYSTGIEMLVHVEKAPRVDELNISDLEEYYCENTAS